MGEVRDLFCEIENNGATRLPQGGFNDGRRIAIESGWPANLAGGSGLLFIPAQGQITDGQWAFSPQGFTTGTPTIKDAIPVNICKPPPPEILALSGEGLPGQLPPSGPPGGPEVRQRRLQVAPTTDVEDRLQDRAFGGIFGFGGLMPLLYPSLVRRDEDDKEAVIELTTRAKFPGLFSRR